MTADPGRRDDSADEELIAEVALGDRRAFALLMSRHLKRSIALADRIVGDPQEAEDIAQDAFFQIWNRADQWNPDAGRFTTWLYRIVLNRALDVRRRRKPEPMDDAALERPSPEPDAEALAAGRELAQCAEHAVASLPERQRAALSLCFHEGLSCQEAAVAMNVTVPAMESLLVRARRAVRAAIWPVVRPNEGRGA